MAGVLTGTETVSSIQETDGDQEELQSQALAHGEPTSMETVSSIPEMDGELEELQEFLLVHGELTLTEMVSLILKMDGELEEPQVQRKLNHQVLLPPLLLEQLRQLVKDKHYLVS